MIEVPLTFFKLTTSTTSIYR